MAGGEELWERTVLREWGVFGGGVWYLVVSEGDREREGVCGLIPVMITWACFIEAFYVDRLDSLRACWEWREVFNL